MEISPERINIIYTESSRLRNYINLFQENLKLLQEVSLNTAINASKENSAVMADIYKMVANQVRKNTLDMLSVLDEVNGKINELVKHSLAGVKKNTYNHKLLSGKSMIGDNFEDVHNNLVIVQEAISYNTVGLESILSNLNKEIVKVKDLHEKLVFLNKKIWLTTTNLKVENNVRENDKGFFDNIAEVLDEKNEFITKKLEEMSRDILRLDKYINMQF